MSGDTDANHRNPLSSSSSTPSGTSALSVTIEAEPAAKPQAAVAVEPVLAPVEDTEILRAEPTDAVVAGEAEPESTPPEPFDDDVPLEGEPADPVVAAEDEPVEAVAPEPVAAIVEDAVAEPIAASAEETVVEPVAVVAAEAIVPEPVADAELEAEPVLEAALPDEPQILQDNIADAVSEALPDEPAAAQAEPEIARLVLVASEPDPQLTQKLRAAVRETLAQTEARQDRVFHVFGQASAKLKDALDEAGQDAARITFKLMEFAQANVRNNLEFARNYAAVRSVPDMFDLQAAYFTRQMALMNAQAEEFRKLTAELTAKAAAPVKSEIKVLTTSR